jgi:hypothetical protein
MVSTSVVLLGTAAFCLIILSVFLSKSQQRCIADWNVLVWATLDEFRGYLGTKRLFKIVLEDSPPITALATMGCFVGGLFGMSTFGVIFAFGLCALLGGILVNENVAFLQPRVAILLWLYGSIALVALVGFFQSVRMLGLSVAAVIAACILIILLIVEFVIRRLAEYQKGPLIAFSLLVAAAASFLKALGY